MFTAQFNCAATGLGRIPISGMYRFLPRVINRAGGFIGRRSYEIIMRRGLVRGEGGYLGPLLYNIHSGTHTGQRAAAPAPFVHFALVFIHHFVASVLV